jgi:hypothetical protein
MPIQQIPLMKGLNKSPVTADYIDALPENMIAVPKPILNSNGYLKSFPGIKKRNDVAGLSRGAMFNSHENAVYRVLGNALYKGQSQVADATIEGTSRVSMACSYTSQAVAYEGKLSLYRYDGTVEQFGNWDSSSGYISYELGEVSDICRNRGRYIVSKKNSDTFFVTDSVEESKPDRYAAKYIAQSQPDGIIGIDSWRDFVLCFGTTTTEFFVLTGASSGIGAALYAPQPNMMIQIGIAGTHCKTKFADGHAIISNPATGAPSIYIIKSGAYQPIATASVEKIIQSYTAEELSRSVLESTRFEGHQFLIVHLPTITLIYDAAVTEGGAQWSILKTGLGDKVYRGIDFVYENNSITCGDRLENVTGELDSSISSQYGQDSEHVLYTPLIKADKARVFDLELETSSGVTQRANSLFISATTDGINYGIEKIAGHNKPFVYDSRILWRSVGYVRKNIGFKFRVITNYPVVLSGLQIRLE